jgi:DNA polymerase-3 subunit gamma/tau
MSYLVFARKYRPRNFDEIIGQEHVSKSLKNAILSNKIAHAYIFSGPRGVGKTSCARILAKSLNCKDAPTIKPCGECPACREISEGRSMDVIEIDGASNRGIDDIRNLRENVKFAPTLGKYKIYIIDEVHQITPDGFNALLKTLEEPPPYVKFIFATTSLHKVIPTIRSRCQRFEFRPIPASSILLKLEEIVKKEGIKIEKNALFAIAKASEGSLRDAESILDQLNSYARGKINLDDVTSVLGLIEEDLLYLLVDKIIKKDTTGALEIIDRFMSEGKEATVLVSSLIEYFRNLMVIRTTQGRLTKLLDVSQDTYRKIFEQAGKIKLSEVLDILDILIDSQEIFKKIDSRRIPLEITVIKLTGGFDKNLNSSLSVSKSNVSKLKEPQDNKIIIEKTEPSPQEKKQEDKSKNNNPPSNQKSSILEKTFSLDDVLKVWHDTLKKIGQMRMSIATYLNEGRLLKVENNILFIGFSKKFKFHKDFLEKKENNQFVEKNLSQALDAKLKVNFVLYEEKIPEAEEEVEPSIKSAIEAFKGRIIGRFRKD